MVGSLFILASALIALRATNARGDTEPGEPERSADGAEPSSPGSITGEVARAAASGRSGTFSPSDPSYK
jgi:hypothetical protein